MEFVSPKSTKALLLDALMTGIPPLTTSPPPKDDLPDDFLFFKSMEDPWYEGILLYLRTQKFAAHLNHEDKRRI